DDMACILVEADSVTVRNNLIDEPLHGIYVKGGSRAHLEGNRIAGRLDLIEADRGNGIHLWNSRDNRIVGNEIRDVRDGIYFSFADSTVITGNHIHHARYGLHYMYSNHNTFEDNLFESNVPGAALMFSRAAARRRAGRDPVDRRARRQPLDRLPRLRSRRRRHRRSALHHPERLPGARKRLPRGPVLPAQPGRG
ncbi:MAG: hypothetical protein GY836_13055, partial [Herbaspirillum sp.]|uniref:right-handed parallel beta-helix repeat-containing protein n=1 Tax=Herbaspirillum sp. TaxID=1890675 RepID=UPI00258FE623